MSEGRKGFRETIKQQKSAVIYLSIFAVVCIVGIILILFVGEPEDTTKTNRTDKIVKIGGVKCVAKPNIETYLLIGTDVKGKLTAETTQPTTEEGNYGTEETTKDEKDIYNPGRADVITLLVIDREKNTYALLPIDRDTITAVDSLDENGNYLATTNIQLALAYEVADGKEKSCENTMKAVSELLHDQYIDEYTALSQDAIKVINNAVGGVTVKIEDDFSDSDKSLKKGKTIKLNDEQAQHYVHDRMNVGDGSNECRMRRQNEYMKGLKKLVGERTDKNPQFPLNVYRSLHDYMITSMSGEDASKITKAVLKNKYLGTFKIKGKSKKDDYGYNAYYPNKKSLDEVVRKLFYDEVDKDGHVIDK